MFLHHFYYLFPLGYTRSASLFARLQLQQKLHTALRTISDGKCVQEQSEHDALQESLAKIKSLESALQIIQETIGQGASSGEVNGQSYCTSSDNLLFDLTTTYTRHITQAERERDSHKRWASQVWHSAVQDRERMIKMIDGLRDIVVATGWKEVGDLLEHALEGSQLPASPYSNAAQTTNDMSSEPPTSALV